MTTDRRDRDLLEPDRPARLATRTPAGVERLPADDVAATELLRARRKEELVLLQRGADDVERPYLRELPSTYASEVTAFEWLDYLVNRTGFKATGRALSYYESIGWISADAEEELRTYLRGFSQVESLDPDGPGPRELGVDDHVLSLVYIARLAALA